MRPPTSVSARNDGAIWNANESEEGERDTHCDGGIGEVAKSNVHGKRARGALGDLCCSGVAVATQGGWHHVEGAQPRAAWASYPVGAGAQSGGGSSAFNITI